MYDTAHADHRHVEDVCAQHQQAAILEDQRLHADHGGQHQDRRPGTQQDGGDGCAHQVTRGAACHGKVEHLPGKDGRCQHAHHRHLALTQIFAHPLQSVPDDNDGDNP